MPAFLKAKGISYGTLTNWRAEFSGKTKKAAKAKRKPARKPCRTGKANETGQRRKRSRPRR